MIQGKKEPAGPKRRVKSAGRAGKSVSFVDEKSESDNPDVPAIDLVPKEEATVKVECPFKKDTQVIGEDRSAREKLSYFVPMEDMGVGLGSGPIEKRLLSGSGWPGDHESAEDSLLAVINSDSEESVSSGEDEGESEVEEQASPGDVDKTQPSLDFNHILNSLQPQYGSEPVFVFERRNSCKTPQTPLPTDPKHLMIHLQMQEKRKNIEKIRQGLQSKWEEERAALNRHVFYEALKKTRDIGEQANSEDIRDELERSDSLDQLVPHLGARSQQEPFSAKSGHPNGVVASNVKPPSLLDKAIADTEIIFSPVVDEEDKAIPEKPPSPPQKPPLSPITTTTRTKTPPKREVPAKKTTEVAPPESTSELVAVFSNHEDFLSTKITESDVQSISTSMSRKPTAMQYFYGFSDVASDDKISQRRQQFFVAQKKKQEELKARRELDLQRKLVRDRQQSHVEGELRRHEGNLVTKCPRAKSSRVRVMRNEDKILPATRPASSAAPGRNLMTCRTPQLDSTPDQTLSRATEQTAPRGTGQSVPRGTGQTAPRGTGQTAPRETSCRNQSNVGREDNRGHMYPDRSRMIESGGATYRKHPADSSPDSRSIRNQHLREKLGNTPKSSPRPPALPLFVAPSAKSNSKVICNAICWTCLGGVPDKQQQQLALQAIANSQAQQYIILFRDHIAKKFRAIYTYENESAKLLRIYGKGPKTIVHSMISNLYKYDSGSRAFSKLPTLTFSLSVDAITIKNELWRKAGVYPC
ncbi:hypothetical protein ACHWQZ_G005103 [Mnemiopsis leidyi]